MSGGETHPCPECSSSLRWDAEAYKWKCDSDDCDYSAAPAQRTCGNCQSTAFTEVQERPQAGAGCIVALLGLLLAPVLIGIPIMIIGLIMRGKGTDWRVCQNCGARTPIRQL